MQGREHLRGSIVLAILFGIADMSLGSPVSFVGFVMYSLFFISARQIFYVISPCWVEH